MNDAAPRPQAIAPVIELARIRKIRTIEVMETDLDGLDRIVSGENSALGFFTGTAAACLSTGLGWIAASGLSPVGHAVYGAATFTTFILGLWFLVQWRIARTQRPALLRELRARAR